MAPRVLAEYVGRMCYSWIVAGVAGGVVYLSAFAGEKQRELSKEAGGPVETKEVLVPFAESLAEVAPIDASATEKIAEAEDSYLYRAAGPVLLLTYHSSKTALYS